VHYWDVPEFSSEYVPEDEPSHSRVKFSVGVMVRVAVALVIIAAFGVTLFLRLNPSKPVVAAVSPVAATAESRTDVTLDNGELVTKYSGPAYGLYTTAPGNNWSRPIGWQQHNGNYILTSDGKAMFGFIVAGVALTTDQATNAIGGKPQQSTVTTVPYLGYSATRVEGTTDLGGSTPWHAIYMIFSANNVTYVLVAASTTDVWDKGGKEVATGILDKVKIEQQSVVLAPVPTAVP
jgi:hypothetical protein